MEVHGMVSIWLGNIKRKINWIHIWMLRMMKKETLYQQDFC